MFHKICFSFLTVALVIVNAQNTTHAPCGTNEEFNECGTACEPSCLNTSPEVCNFSCTPNVCQCLLGYVRNSEGGCVASSDCPTEASTEAPEATSCGQNEVLHECASGCEPSCADPSPVCALQCLAHTCECALGFVRSKRGCILASQCKAVASKNPKSFSFSFKFLFR